MNEIKALGANLVAVSPIERRFAARTVDKYGLRFPVLVDPGNEVASAFQLTIVVPEPLRDVYYGFGIDLERVNGDRSWTLPLPTRYVIGTDGLIVDARTNTDHTLRPEPEETLAVLRRIKDGA
ncbi:alkyl hydroperoxide reductase/thiol-specific antioxidant protein [Desulfuromonas soudanensis]|uniref:Alkyl hydroperoxide reductase/thiol-specific antioxidant protein n=1 Tax=Desulfuromonas soudanensis TaxID=1603606 RepID=A0A0M4D6E3_9BACT|nr:alkyl hydroperoxide reductase/thiol-specific antioxidant protein [Desulfuromonas soudanensis]